MVSKAAVPGASEMRDVSVRGAGEFPLMISRGRFHKTANPLRVVVMGCRMAARTVDLTPTITKFFPPVRTELDCSIRRFEEVLEHAMIRVASRVMPV